MFYISVKYWGYFVFVAILMIIYTLIHMKKPLHTHRRLVLTCQSGLESLVKRECERLGCTEIQAQDRLISCTGTERNMYELLIWSRFSNRVYIELAREKTDDFDQLYNTLN